MNRIVNGDEPDVRYEEYVKALIQGEANLLICETCLDTGTRISEVTGLMVKHVDLEKGTIQIAQRNWHMDIDVPKTEKGKRVLALGALLPRHKTWIAGHASTAITEEYTIVQLKRQDDLTRRIQEKRAKAAKRAKKVVEISKKEAVA